MAEASGPWITGATWPAAWIFAIATCGGLLPAGCSKPKLPDATLPVPSLSVNFSNGRLLNPARISEIFPDFQLTDAEVVPAPLIFGYGLVDALNLSEPVILRKLGNNWKFVVFPSLNHTGWVYAGASFERGELWAILDSTPDSKGAGLYLFRSADHGESWQLFSGVKPPTIQAEFVAFTMTADGHGRITVHQDDDTAAIPRGLYAYASTDGGKTWTGPAFTADDLISADNPPYPTLQESLPAIDPSAAPSRTAPAPLPNRPGRRGLGN